MVAKGGAPLLQQEAVHALITDLLPHALITTPNIPEAELITGMTIRNLADREEAARRIVHMGSAYALVKGGHAEGNGMIVDVLYDGTSFHYLENVRIVTRHTHGTGCTYSAAITAELAKGSSVLAAVTTARAFIQAAIEDELGIGAGHGPTNHFAYQRRQRVNSDAQMGCGGGTPGHAGVPGDGQREYNAGPCGCAAPSHRRWHHAIPVPREGNWRLLAKPASRWRCGFARCSQHGIPFIVNDDVELAVAVEADGMHVGQDDADAALVRARIGAGRMLGVSAHSVAEARRAVQAGADYLGVGPMYPTRSKADAHAVLGPAGWRNCAPQASQFRW